MSIKANVRRAGDVAVVELAGRITLGEGSGLVRNTIKDLLNSGQKNILLDLSGVTYLDSAGLGEVVGAYASVSSAGGVIKLLNPAPKVYDLLQVTKLYTVFSVYDDEPTALRSFSEPAAAGR